MTKRSVWRFLLAAACALVGVVVTTRAFDPITDESGVDVIVWKRGTIPMVNNLPSSTTLSDGTTFRSSLDAAMNRWNGVLGNVQFSSSHGATGSYGIGNEVNELVLDSTIEGYEFGDTTLAVTLSYTNGDTYRVESDVVFNSRWDWDSYRGPLRAEDDVRRVGLHELGHVLGLGHPDQASPAQSVAAIMNSLESHVDDLLADDIAGGQWLYGSPDQVPPPNDNFADAAVIGFVADDLTIVEGANFGASGESGEPAMDELGPGVRSVWWEWTPTRNGIVTVTTLGSPFDTMLGVYVGTAVDALTEVVSNDDIDPGVVRSSVVEFEFAAGTTYHIAVDGWDGHEGVIFLSFSTEVIPGPLIAMTDSRVVGETGEAVVLSGTATPEHGGSLSYQWLKNGLPVEGATSPNLTLPFFSNRDAGHYVLEVREENAEVGYGLVFVLPDYAQTDVVMWGGDVSDAVRQLPEFSQPVLQVAVGDQHGLALLRDGTVVGWGEGPGAEPPAELSEVVAISAGTDFSVALKSNGRVIAWGSDDEGQIQVPRGLHHVVAIDAGWEYTLAVGADGGVTHWGDDKGGAVIPPSDLGPVVSVDAELLNVAALMRDGAVRVWGSEDSTHVVPSHLGPFVDVKAGRSHVQGLTATGRLEAWGSNAAGSLNVPTGAQRYWRQQAGDFFGSAIRFDGTVVAWGSGNQRNDVPPGLNSVVQMDASSTAVVALRSIGQTHPPVLIEDLPGTLLIGELNTLTLSIEVGGDDPVSFAWKKDGVLLSDSLRVEGSGGPTLRIVDVIPDDAGIYTVEATNRAGSVTSTETNVSVVASPAIISPPLSQVALSGDSVEMTVAATGTGELRYEWLFDGSPLSGATAATLSLPSVGREDGGRYEVRVSDDYGDRISLCFLTVAEPGTTVESTAKPPAGVTAVAQIDAADRVMAVLADGSVQAWGGSYGPSTVWSGSELPAVEVAADDQRCYILLADGSVTAVGSSLRKTNILRAGIPTNLENVVAIGANNSSVAALQADGTVRVWGLLPDPPASLRNVVQVGLGDSQAVALRRDGTLQVWTDRDVRWPYPEYQDVVVEDVQVGRYNFLTRDSSGNLRFQNGVEESGFIKGLANVVSYHHGPSGGMALLEDGTYTTWSETGYPTGSPNLFNHLPLSMVRGNFYAAIIEEVAPQSVTIEGASEIAETEGLHLRVFTDLGNTSWSAVWFKDGVQLDAWERMSVSLWGDLYLYGATPADSGTYVVEIFNAAGRLASEEFTVAVRSAPSIEQQPEGATLYEGDSRQLMVDVTGGGLSYQWMRDGEEIPGANLPTLDLDNVLIADSGIYSVAISNVAGTVISFDAVILVEARPPDYSADHTVGDALTAGSHSMPITNGFHALVPLEGLTWSVLLPEGWSFLDTTAANFGTGPESGDTDVLTWWWSGESNVPTSFDYTLSFPDGTRGRYELVATFTVENSGGEESGMVSPDPLIIVLGNHSADTDGDLRISLSELLRVIELYNTRAGTTRTGRYRLAETTEDGFAPDDRTEGEGDGPTRFHSADVDHDARLSLSELLRVIELYNTRAGTTRTGGYRIDAGTEDGFAPDAGAGG